MGKRSDCRWVALVSCEMRMERKKFFSGGQTMGLWVFYVCFSYSISTVYTSANFINVCICVSVFVYVI